LANQNDLSLIVFKGSDYTSQAYRNIEVFFHNLEFNPLDDLVVVEVSQQIDNKDYVVDKTTNKIKRFFIHSQLIEEVEESFYKFELFLNTLLLSNKDFTNEEFLIRCSIIKEYKESALFENIKEDPNKALFELIDNTIKGKSQIFSTTGRSDKAKIKQLIKVRGIKPQSDSPEKITEKKQDQHFEIDFDRTSIDFDTELYRIFVNFAVLLSNADGKLTSEEKKAITDLAPGSMPRGKVNGIIEYSIMEYQRNNITFSGLVIQINNNFEYLEKVALIKSLYSVALSDGSIDNEELKILELIAENIDVNFQTIKQIKLDKLKNVNIKKDEQDFSDLDINFSGPINSQIDEAKYQLSLWSNRLSIAEGNQRIEYQLLIDKYSDFLSYLENSGHKIIDSQRSNLNNHQTFAKKTSIDEDYEAIDYDLQEEIKYSKSNFPLPPPSSDSRVMNIRKEHKRAYARWTVDEEDYLVYLFDELEMEFEVMAKVLQRQISAITARLSKLELIDDEYEYWN